MNKEKANKILEEMLDSLAFKFNDSRIAEEKKHEIVEEKIKELEVFAKEHGLTFTLPNDIFKEELYRFFDGNQTVQEFLDDKYGYYDQKQVKEMHENNGTMFWYHSQYCSY